MQLVKKKVSLFQNYINRCIRDAVTKMFITVILQYNTARFYQKIQLCHQPHPKRVTTSKKPFERVYVKQLWLITRASLTTLKSLVSIIHLFKTILLFLCFVFPQFWVLRPGFTFYFAFLCFAFPQFWVSRPRFALLRYRILEFLSFGRIVDCSFHWLEGIQYDVIHNVFCRSR